MIAIYDALTGVLVSTAAAPSDVTSPLPVGLASKTVADPDPETQVWDTTLRDWAARPARPPARMASTEIMADPDIAAMTAANRTRVRNALDAYFPRKVIVDREVRRG